MDIERGRDLVGECIEAVECVAVARDQAVAARLDVAEPLESVVFDIEEPVGIVEWVHAPCWRDGLDARRRHPSHMGLLLLVTSPRVRRSSCRGSEGWVGELV